MTQLRPIPRAKGPIYAYVPIERIRPRSGASAASAAIAAEPVAPAEKPKEPRDPLEAQKEALREATLLSDLLDLVAREFKLSRGVLRAPNRRHAATKPRKIFCYIAREHFGKSLPHIGRVIRRDHSTVMYCVRSVKARPGDFEPALSRILAQCPARDEQDPQAPQDPLVTHEAQQ